MADSATGNANYYTESQLMSVNTYSFKQWVWYNENIMDYIFKTTDGTDPTDLWTCL